MGDFDGPGPVQEANAACGKAVRASPRVTVRYCELASAFGDCALARRTYCVI